MKATAILAAVIALRATGLSAQSDGYELPLKPTRTVAFTTDEGTWMSLDVSPDGRTIVFDLLGDLYTLPISGGKATRITSGMAWDGQPRFSPDGRTIVFSSDRSGAENLWLINPDGTNIRALTKGKDKQYISPEWTPGGKEIIVSRADGITGTRHDLYLYHLDGGSGVKLNQTAAGSPDNFLGAAFGSDPRYLYVAARSGSALAAWTFPTFQLGLFDRVTGKAAIRSDLWGSGFRPAVSPDGKWLIYATRRDTATSLRLRDLETGDERWLIHNVQRDGQEARAVLDILPGYSFMPDGKSIIISYGGKFWNVAVPSGSATPIPFTAEVRQELGPLARFDYGYGDSTVVARQIRNATPSPDGRRLAFAALDRIWVMNLPNGKPARLTNLEGGEAAPTWSPDGRYIAFVTWSDDEGGAIRRKRGDGSGAIETLTRQPGYFDQPAYSPDGSRIVAYMGPRRPRLDPTQGEEGRPFGGDDGVDLVWIPAEGGTSTRIIPAQSGSSYWQGRPHFAKESDRVYFWGRDGFISVRLDGTDERVVLKATGSGADSYVMSPDGRQVLVTSKFHVYIVPLPEGGAHNMEVSFPPSAASPIPVRRLTRYGGDFAGWGADAKSVHYSLGRFFFSVPLDRIQATHADSVAEPTCVEARVAVPRDRPIGTVLLSGARIITMKGTEIIDRGDILIRNDRIEAIGKKGSLRVPAGTEVVRVDSKTIIPGYVDIHAHIFPSHSIHRTQVWHYLANLAYGVTTTRDPSTNGLDPLSYADLVETGQILGPRLFSTGPAMTSDFAAVKSLDEARDLLRRFGEYYETETIKQYASGGRKERQWIVMAANELKLTPTVETYADYKKNMTEALDGYAGLEHSLHIMPLYNDAVQLLAQSGITYTPTLVVDYGPPVQDYFLHRGDLHADQKLRQFTPHNVVDRESLRDAGFARGWFHESQYLFARKVAQMAKIVAAGGKVGLGSHGQVQGIAAHWELWSFGIGGMTRHDALRAGTIFPAEAIGHAAHVGSLEPGKFADLQVLDRNPLDDIYNTNTIRYVMKNGRLYDGNTLAEVWPRKKELPVQWWQKDR